MIKIEFWNGQCSNKKKYEEYGGLVTTGHNPCLWSNVLCDEKPWRNVYIKALEYLEKWKNKEINDSELLHSLRYVAYGYNDNGEDKRSYDNTDVVWPGNLTIKHKPKLTVRNDEEEYTIYFYFNGSEEDLPTDDKWKTIVTDDIMFYWSDN